MENLQISFLDIEQSPFFDRDCPDAQILLSPARTASLRDYLGNVIVLRFSRFNPHDMDNLYFLDTLSIRFRPHGLQLFFVYPLIRDNSIKPYEQDRFSSRIVDDDGYLASLFQASLNDLIIIDKSFRIKIKHNNLNNPTIYSLIVRYLFDGQESLFVIPESLREELLKKASYLNIRSQQVEHLGEKISKKPAIVNMFLSACMSCLTEKRISLIKELAMLKESRRKHHVFILFGSENSFDDVIKFADMHNFPFNVTLGVLSESKEFRREEKAQLFKYYIDPFIVIINEHGQVVFSEELGDSNKLDASLIERMLQRQH